MLGKINSFVDKLHKLATKLGKSFAIPFEVLVSLTDGAPYVSLNS